MDNKNTIGQSLYAQSSGSAPLVVHQVDFEYSGTFSFREKLAFLFGKKNIHVSNSMKFSSGVLTVKNELMLRNKNA